MTPQKATFTRVGGPGKFVCQFNPEGFSLGKTYTWKELEKTGEGNPSLVFGGGKAQRLDISLLFDSTDTGGDVRAKYAALLDLAEIYEGSENQSTGKGEPSRCRFEWGSFQNAKNVLEGVIESVSQEFTLFKDDGTPLRAKVKIGFKQLVEKRKGQNPTSRSEPRKTWVVQEGQTLNWIAYQEYGDPAAWRHIAETNNLDNPMDLRPGQILKLVPLL